MHTRFVQVGVPSPVFGLFDYRWRLAGTPLPGQRVSVPFGRRQVVGVLVRTIGQSAVPPARLRDVVAVHDAEPLLSAELLELLEWASRYYRHPLGEVLQSALPVLLRRPAPVALSSRRCYRLLDARADVPARASVQRRLLQALAEADGQVLDEAALAALSGRWRAAMKPLLERGVVQQEQHGDWSRNVAVDAPPPLFDEQQAALAAIRAHFDGFAPMLLHGVTGSGKTEVYLHSITAAVAQRRQVLVLVPEIALTPQLLQRFRRRIDGCLVSLHSALNDSERLQNWLLAVQGHADVIIGTRSAVLVPLPRLGLIVVDEEHDNSLKQQDGFRYHARDLALMRARRRACPVILGSATPSFETLNNVATGRYRELILSRRAGNASAPTLALLDIRRRPLIEGMSDRLLAAIDQHLQAGGQALIFINRRGFAPTLLCNDCGACADCRRCDAHLTVHLRLDRLRCHHCGAERALPRVCETCGSENLDRVGHGTERIADALAERFPDVPIARIDRDSTRRRGALESRLDDAVSGRARLLVGTQMLAKGHHFPGVTLVGILDADRGLYGTDFRSLEHMAQLVIQVAGRAGRETRPGTVLVQTRNPDNDMLQLLVRQGYPAFASASLDDRRAAGLPPFAYLALVRAEAVDAAAPQQFLDAVAQHLRSAAGALVQVLGPAPAPMERVAGRYRAQLLLLADRRGQLSEALGMLTEQVESLPGVRRIRWSIDVDPVDLF